MQKRNLKPYNWFETQMFKFQGLEQLLVEAFFNKKKPLKEE
jgi:hypothetical protein